MGCCGQKRDTLKSAPAIGARPAPSHLPGPTRESRSPELPKPGSTGPAYAVVGLRYLERTPIRVRGPVTGREYSFSGAHPVQAVDTRDADALLRTRFFRKGA